MSDSVKCKKGWRENNVVVERERWATMQVGLGIAIPLDKLGSRPTRPDHNKTGLE